MMRVAPIPPRRDFRAGFGPRFAKLSDQTER